MSAVSAVQREGPSFARANSVYSFVRHGKSEEPEVEVDFYLPAPKMEIWMFSDILRENRAAVEIVEAGRGFFVSTP